MNDYYYYLVGDENEMDGPYNIDDIRAFYNKQDPSFSQEKVVINADTRHKYTIGEIINEQSISPNIIDINAQDEKRINGIDVLVSLVFMAVLLFIGLFIIYWVITYFFCD